MKLREAITRVDRSDKNTFDASMDNFSELFGFGSCGWNDEFSARMKEHWLIKWHCTDSWVGMRVYCLDNEPVAVSYQRGRKCDEDIMFVSHEACGKVRELVRSLLPSHDEPGCSMLDLDDELDDFYHVEYASDLLARDGFVGGRPATVNPWDNPSDSLSKKVKVTYEDGSTELVPLSKFDIPLHVTPAVVPSP